MNYEYKVLVYVNNTLYSFVWLDFAKGNAINSDSNCNSMGNWLLVVYSNYNTINKIHMRIVNGSIVEQEEINVNYNDV